MLQFFVEFFMAAYFVEFFMAALFVKFCAASCRHCGKSEIFAYNYQTFVWFAEIFREISMSKRR